MIPAKNRIPKKLFPGVMHGLSIPGRFFRVIISRSTPTTFAVAVVASKKHAPTAVLRNRLRRTVYRIADHHKSDLPNQNIVFLLTTPIKTLKTQKEAIFSEIKQDIDQLFQKIVKKYGK